MYDKSLKPSEIIALQKKVIEDQESIIETLKGALAAAGVEAPSADAQAWLSGLTRQESALVGALFRCYPRPVDKYDLLDSLPGYDSVEERQVQLVAVNVHHLRKKLGADAVESVRGVGYRLSSRLHETIRGRRTTAQNVAMRRSKPELRLAA